MCCLPRTATDITTTYGLLSDSALSNSCDGAACIATFLSDYITTTNYGCSNALIAQESFNRESNAPWISCSNSIFGANLAGAPCSADADCANGLCDTRTHLCANQSYDSLVNAFLTCLLVDQPGLVLPTVIRTYELSCFDFAVQNLILEDVGTTSAARPLQVLSPVCVRHSRVQIACALVVLR